MKRALAIASSLAPGGAWLQRRSRYDRERSQTTM